MKNKSILLTVFFVLFYASRIFAQEARFFMPNEIKKTYEAGTRSFDGKPGAKYWQNTADYKIDVTIDAVEKMIDGKESITYFNNSPDVINTLVVRLYYDVYKKGNTRHSPLKAEDITDGVDLSKVKINGQTYDLENKRMVSRYGTNISFRLQEPLEPGKSLDVDLNWKQNIPHTNRRTGIYDSTTFFIGQWYPQISVYDDIFGWDMLDFNINTEFYNNLANFDVKMTIPENYALWATGTFKNAKDVLPDNIYTKYIKAKESEKVVHVIDSTDLKNGFKTKSNTWHFTAKEVSDFAFGLSSHFQWDAAIVKIGDRDIIVQSAFPDAKADKYTDHAAMLQKVITHFSNDFPRIPYPYEAFTVFIGLYGGGMEYPMMANNAGPGTGLAIHEMFHTYFPMYVRINERRWAWMDEGWAEYGTTVVQNRYFKNKSDFESIFAGEKLSPDGTMGGIADLPLIISSQFMDDYNYGYASYSLPANVYGILHQYLGEEMFMKCYREYIRRWAKKSPSPYDFFYTFENVSGQDLSWIWKPWFFEFGYPDVSVVELKKNKLLLKNSGNKPIPVFVDIMYKDSTTKQISKTAKVWTAKKPVVITIPDYKNLMRLSVNKNVSDMNGLDNFYPPISEWYKSMDIPEDIYGNYNLPLYQADIQILKKQGIAYFVIKNWGVDIAIIPENSTVFKTLDGVITLNFQFNEEDDCTGIKIDWYDYKLDAKKL